MKTAAKILLAMSLVPVAISGVRAQPRFYCGSSSALEAVSDVPDTVEDVVLEGKSGEIIAHDIVCADRPAFFHAFVQALRGPIGHSYDWTNPVGKSRGKIRVTWEFRNDTVLCRDFALDHTIGGHRYLRQGTACLESDGNWHLH